MRFAPAFTRRWRAHSIDLSDWCLGQRRGGSSLNVSPEELRAPQDRHEECSAYTSPALSHFMDGHEGTRLPASAPCYFLEPISSRSSGNPNSALLEDEGEQGNPATSGFRVKACRDSPEEIAIASGSVLRGRRRSRGDRMRLSRVGLPLARGRRRSELLRLVLRQQQGSHLRVD